MTQPVFEAELLFDGNIWHRNYRFQVNLKGNIEIPPPTTDIKIKSLGIVIPGFLNSHSHAFQRAMAGRGELLGGSQLKDSFWTWRNQMYDLVHHIDENVLRSILRFLFMEMLESGYTSLGEFHYLHHPKTNLKKTTPVEESLRTARRLLAESELIGIQLCLLPVLYENSGFDQPALEKQRPFLTGSLTSFYELIHQLQMDCPATSKIGIALHSLRAVGENSLLNCLEHFQNQDLPRHIHIAEQPAEVEECLRSRGQRPVSYLMDRTTIDESWTLIHATHLSAVERRSLAQSKASVCLCPITEANLGDGIFPLVEFLEEGGQICIGSDSNIHLDPFEELRWLEYSQRYRYLKRACVSNPDEPSPGTVLARQAYRTGQKSLDLPVGFLRSGHQANFVVLRQDHPATIRKQTQTLWDEILFSSSKEIIDEVYVGGVRQVSQGQHRSRKSCFEDYSEAILELEDRKSRG
jgi:formimidoylglutamate deiminase